MNKKRSEVKMSAEKTTTTAIATPLGIIIVLPVCCFVILSGVVVTPISIAIGVRAHSGANNSSSGSIDDSASIIRTTYATASSSALKSKEDNNSIKILIPSVLYRFKDCDEQSI